MILLLVCGLVHAKEPGEFGGVFPELLLRQVGVIQVSLSDPLLSQGKAVKQGCRGPSPTSIFPVTASTPWGTASPTGFDRM